MTSQVYRRSAELLEAEVGDELVGLNPEAGLCFGFNDVATAVWRSLEEPKSFSELRDNLLEQYDVGLEECTNELRELLEDLAAKGLIEKCT